MPELRSDAQMEVARMVAVALIISVLVVLGPVQYFTHFVLYSGANPDFKVFWTAAQIALDDPSRLYDHQYVTDRQAPLAMPEAGLRPWVYPPSALPLFLPFSALPFWVAFWLYNAASLAIFWTAARLLVRGLPLAIAILSPPVTMALETGQTALVIGALVIAGVVGLKKRPVLSGVLLGVAAAWKPQILILAPLALISGGHWRSLAAFFCGGAAMVAASLVFGLTPWLDWLTSTGDFLEIARQKGLYGITPIAMIGGPIVTALCVVAGPVLTWWAFRQEDYKVRITGLVCGALILSPYAMRYELAVLAPVAAAVLYSSGGWRWLAAITLLSVPTALAVVALPVSLIGGLLRRISYPSSAIPLPGERPVA